MFKTHDSDTRPSAATAPEPCSGDDARDVRADIRPPGPSALSLQPSASRPKARPRGPGSTGTGNPTAPRRSRTAFTLIELLIVITVIMILVGLVLGSLSLVRENAQVLTSKTRMQEVTRRLQALGTGGRSPAGLIVDAMTTYRLEFKPLEHIVGTLIEGYDLRLEPANPGDLSNPDLDPLPDDDEHAIDYHRLPPRLHSIAEYDDVWPAPGSYHHYGDPGGFNFKSRRRTMIGEFATSGFYYGVNHNGVLERQRSIHYVQIPSADSDGWLTWISPYNHPTVGIGGGRAKTLENMLMIGRLVNFNLSEYMWTCLYNGGSSITDDSALIYVDPFMKHDSSNLEDYADGLLPENGNSEFSSQPQQIQWQHRDPQFWGKTKANSDGTLATRHMWVFDWAAEELKGTLEVAPPPFEDALKRVPDSDKSYYQSNKNELAWTRQQYLEKWPLYVEVKADPPYVWDQNEYLDDVGNVISGSPYLYSFAWDATDWNQEEPGTIPPLWPNPWGRARIGRDGRSADDFPRYMFRDEYGDLPDMRGTDLSAYRSDPDTITDDYPDIRGRTLADLSPLYTMRLLQLAEILPQEEPANKKGGRYDFRIDRSNKRPFNDAWGNPLIVGAGACLAPRFGPYPEDRDHSDGVVYTEAVKSAHDPGTPPTSLEYHQVQGASSPLPKHGARDYLMHRYQEIYGSARYAYVTVGAMGPERGVYGTDNPIESVLGGHSLTPFAGIQQLKWQLDGSATDAEQTTLDRQVLRASWLMITETAEVEEWTDASFKDSPWDEYHKGEDPAQPNVRTVILEPSELE